ncbi:unnamed protein product [Adineta ricciae]|uniref:DNA polymerase n=1 Tax=Adineta ricciae TaxID=249248 RepID=A0A815GAD6_ADIRI|nr:unnamed protein product [Adineta ricciae]CAF1336737.1 unnamed protein product [Adineta ricciae]
MSSDRSRREIKVRGNDAQRLNALEQLKRARQGGQAAVAEQSTNKNECEDVDGDEEDEEEEEEEDDYESDSAMYEDIKPSTKRKSSNSHHKDSKRLKKKRHSSGNEDNDGEDDHQKTKASESKRRAQVFAKPQEESTRMQDIKSMFAANKTRNIQRQEQIEKDDSDKLLSDIMFELQKPKTKPTHPLTTPSVSVPVQTPTAVIPKKLEVKPAELLPPEEIKPASVPQPSSHIQRDLDWGDDDSMSFDAVSKLMNDAAPPPQPTHKIPSPPCASKSLIQFDTQELEFVTDEQLLKSARTFHTSPSKETDQNESANKDEHLRFFWFDAYEDPVAQPGKLFLFGKSPLLNEDKTTSKTFVSVCLIVDNIPKQIFLVPKSGSTASDVEDELFIIAKRFKITNYTSSIVKKRRFDPELVATDLLNEVDVVEMKYPARCATLPSDLQGDLFQSIYGTNQTALEYILIDKKLKGPCWLNIKNCAPVKTRRSWCKLEYDVDYYHGADRQITNIEISTVVSPPPPLVTMTLSLVTLPNSKTHETEVICVSGLVHQQFPMDSAAPKRPYQNYFVALTKPSDCILPPGLIKAAESQKINIAIVPGERALLMYLISKFQLLDPDVIVGHDMRMFGLELFLSRCQKLKVGLTASKIGRLHRTHDGKTKVSTIKNPTCGRLLCDISISARELLTKCKSYDLEELCKVVLNTEQQQLYRAYSIDQTREAFSSSVSVVDLVQATLNNTSLILNIFCQLMVLPLAYQLTCIAGNLLSRTLAGGRSERNDHLLLHAFTEKDYIVPERTIISNHRSALKHTQEVHNESDEELDDDPNKKKTTKPSSTSYTGGLVLAPKKGFYDHFILLLDFNSLYPSIIQEFNVCFTTYMKKSIQSRSNNSEQETNEIDDIVALDEINKGILPLEIYKLVERRREVKKLIKEKKNLTDEQLVQYDIRQKAYKLTANSLYGCLGFKYSRFYCKYLAAFITYKGREILMQAKTIVERMNYDVIYGDTDSIMINTNSTDYDQVMAIGAKIRNEINRQYKSVEIGIDGVFKCMLLLKKKKYAALIVEKSPTQEFTYKTELKGLDIVRRDWCQLARSTGEFVVSVILSGQSRDDVLDTIHNRLRDLGDEMRAGKIDIAEYEINRQLSKDPSDYSDVKSLPHVQIAVRFNTNSTGRKMKRGDTIAYIVCEDGTQNSAMQRGYLREEILSSSSLTIDINYYLHQQLLPVISRLLEPFDGTDQAYLAQCLGLDSSKYKQRQQKNYGDKNDENNLDNGNDDFDDELLFGEGAEAFKQCDPFSFSCVKCDTLNFWNAPFIFNEDKTCASPLLRCTNISCSSQPIDHVIYLRNRLTLMISKAIRRYYQNWLRCEDDTCCAFRTRQTPLEVLHKRHTCTSCNKSDLITEYDDRQLNLQLRFLKQLFNLDSYKQSINRTKSEQIDTYLKSLPADTMRLISKTMNDLQGHIDRIVQKSGYAEVCVSDLFAQFYFNTPIQMS